jgi:Tol biopolymer transport system component/DNA-binding winged helix-turn-helix (wHTH) protein
LKGTFHIADWEVEPQVNSLKRADQSVHVEPKVMQVLVELATHSNEVLTKEQLIHAVWSDTFVSDDALTRCISEIRRVLDDDPRAPRFIQTIPKTGYRLIAPVEYDRVTPRPMDATTLVQDTPRRGGVGVEPLLAPNPRKFGRINSVWLPALLGLLLVAVGIVMLRLWLKPSSIKPQGTFTVVPFTSYPGTQTQPAFSPDGNQIAFVWNHGKDDNQGIYIKMMGNETPLQVTSNSAKDFSPTWSPDGRSLAFLRYSEEDRGIYIVPALGGAARKVFTPAGKIEWERGALSWSPDGRHLIFPDGKSSTSPSSIYSLDLTTATARPVTRPPLSWDGDASPAFSPDGSRIAFVRGIEGWVRDVYVMNTAGGEPVRLTFDDRIVSSLAWTSDSSAIVFSSNRAAEFSLWSVPAIGGNPQRLPVGGEDVFNLAIATKGSHLAYTQTASEWKIQKINLNAPKSPETTVWSSSQEDSAPQFSPDDRRVAFQSLRSGTQEIWVSYSDSSNPVKLTSFQKSLTGSPSWSPDGSQLSFDARPEGRSHIYSIRIEGGVPRILTDGDFNDVVPSWSRDGRSIYFGSNRSGSWQIWKTPSSGGTPQQVTKDGGFVGTESQDGNWLYFAKSDAPGIWRIPVAGGQEQRVVDQPRIGYWGYWHLAKSGIYYLNQTTSPPSVDFVDLDGQHHTKLHVLDHIPPPYAGLTVSADERSLLYNDEFQLGSHITLVDGFR